MSQLVGVKLRKSDSLNSVMYVGEINNEDKLEIELKNPMRVIEFAYPIQQQVVNAQGEPIYQMMNTKDATGKDVQVPSKPLTKTTMAFDLVISDEIFCGYGTLVSINKSEIVMLVKVSSENTPGLFKQYSAFITQSESERKSKTATNKQTMKSNVRKLERRGHA